MCFFVIGTLEKGCLQNYHFGRSSPKYFRDYYKSFKPRAFNNYKKQLISILLLSLVIKITRWRF